MKKTELKAWFANKKNRQGVAVVGFCALLLAGGISYATLSHTLQEQTQTQEQTEVTPQKTKFTVDYARSLLDQLVAQSTSSKVEDVALEGETLYVSIQDVDGTDPAQSLEFATKTGVALADKLNTQEDYTGVPTKLTWIEKTQDSKVQVAYSATTDTLVAQNKDNLKPHEVIAASDSYSLSTSVYEKVKDNLATQEKGVVLDKDKQVVVADGAKAPDDKEVEKEQEEVKAEEEKAAVEEKKAQQEPDQSASSNTSKASDSQAQAPTNNQSSTAGRPKGHYEKRLVTAAWDEPIYETRTRTVVDVPAHTEQRDTGKPKIVFSDGHVVYTNEERIAYQLAHDVAYRVEPLYETIEVPAKTHEESYQVQTGSIHHDAVYQDVWVED